MREAVILRFKESKPIIAEKTKTVRGISERTRLSWKGEINFKLEKIHNFVQLHIQHKIAKAAKKLILHDISPDIFLKLKSPKKPILKNLNKKINTHKIPLATNIDIPARSAGFNPPAIRYFSNTLALAIQSKAIPARIKPIYIIEIFRISFLNTAMTHRNHHT